MKEHPWLDGFGHYQLHIRRYVDPNEIACRDAGRTAGYGTELLCADAEASMVCDLRFMIFESSNNVPRQSLSNDDKSKYLRADQCLMSTAPQYGIPGAQSVWEELQYAHIRNMNFIHGVVSKKCIPNQAFANHDCQSQFLFWHRYYVTTYERLMNRHCDWQGGVP